MIAFTGGSYRVPRPARCTNADMNAISNDGLQVHLAVDDARAAQAAGVTFARRLFGTHSADFALALAEQEHLVERAIVETGQHDRASSARRRALRGGSTE